MQGNYQKDTISSKYEIGFNKDGKQKYFLGIIGYGNTDTSFSIPNTYKKVVDSITFYYNIKTNQVEMFVVNKGDSSFQYNILPEDKPFLECIYIYDNQKRLVKFINLLMNEVEVYLNTNYDKNNNLIYALVQSDYYPTELDKKLYNEEELLLKKAQRKNYIKEIVYTYY